MSERRHRLIAHLADGIERDDPRAEELAGIVMSHRYELATRYRGAGVGIWRWRDPTSRPVQVGSALTLDQDDVPPGEDSMVMNRALPAIEAAASDDGWRVGIDAAAVIRHVAAALAVGAVLVAQLCSPVAPAQTTPAPTPSAAETEEVEADWAAAAEAQAEIEGAVNPETTGE